ncbi:MAG: hypothetical protein WCJ01_06080 [Ignavibacteria bacterium]
MDYREAYEKFVPQEQHIQSQKGTFTAEGYNSLFGHFPAGLRRKSKCYTKAKYMSVCSVILLMLKWNNGLAVIC